jgi:hypothetical protein
MPLLDRHLPEYHMREYHRTRVARPPAAVARAARELRLREVPLLVALMGLRGLSELLARRRSLWLRGRVVDQFLEAGFVVLEDTQGELVIGVAGRFWRLDSGIDPVPAERFGEYAEPGSARAALALGVDPVDGHSVLWTETRVQATDEAARRSFARYWRVIRPGSVLIRHELLRAIRRHAERSG